MLSPLWQQIPARSKSCSNQRPSSGHDVVLLLVDVPAGVVGAVRQQRDGAGEGGLRERHRLQQPHGHVPRLHGGMRERREREAKSPA